MAFALICRCNGMLSNFFFNYTNANSILTTRDKQCFSKRVHRESVITGYYGGNRSRPRLIMGWQKPFERNDQSWYLPSAIDSMQYVSSSTQVDPGSSKRPTATFRGSSLKKSRSRKLSTGLKSLSLISRIEYPPVSIPSFGVWKTSTISIHIDVRKKNLQNILYNYLI